MNRYRPDSVCMMLSGLLLAAACGRATETAPIATMAGAAGASPTATSVMGAPATAVGVNSPTQGAANPSPTATQEAPADSHAGDAPAEMTTAPSTTMNPSGAMPGQVAPVSTGPADTAATPDGAKTDGMMAAANGCCPDCICRASGAPKPEDLDANGPYTAQTFTIPRGMNHGGATVYYPDDAEPPFAYAVFCPPYTATQSAFAAWGPFFASHGIVLATMDSVTTGDYPPQRAQGLEELMGTLKGENANAEGPLMGKLAESRGGVLGWSMGGGGVWIASGKHAEWKSAVTLAGHNITATGWQDSASMSKVPTLMLNGATDTSILGGMNQTQNAYMALPESTPKAMYIVNDLGHFEWGSPAAESNAVGRYVMAWEHVFLEGDERYRGILLTEGPNASTWETNLE